ncbi:DUF4426 domain-containing protein [Arhodomonas aquaeolei]|uniref:DUF4426 domain-containing protein n=1 Tax=Arhodomonas aquaeolei TaxID=2369 RepID=UPI002169E4E5|nr:DUF4426 domain-containing protein [Arhodomonas aquaeolei]MCS4505575.1 DUF4426 domain-containing protein [Arhodomonas aquaeolei]
MKLLRPILAAALALTCATAQAQRSERFGDYEIHYNAIPTAMLAPEVARAYDVARSRGRALVTVTVLRDGRSLPARMTGNAINDAGQPQGLSLREVREGGGIYYIATARIDPPDRLRVELEVRPRDTTDASYTLSFEQSFFPEE